MRDSKWNISNVPYLGISSQKSAGDIAIGNQSESGGCSGRAINQRVRPKLKRSKRHLSGCKRREMCLFGCSVS